MISGQMMDWSHFTACLLQMRPQYSRNFRYHAITSCDQIRSTSKAAELAIQGASQRIEVILEFGNHREVPWGASAFLIYLPCVLAILEIVSGCEVTFVVLRCIVYRESAALVSAVI
jgi:hypothetical protein